MSTTKSSVREVFLAFLRLGCTAFGGPVAHLAYFHHELVQRRRWLSDAAYAELLALCQILPGPASSQMGFALGLWRAGWPGALVAWLAFTLPSALIMVTVALLLTPSAEGLAFTHGLKLAAVVMVGHAVFTMARQLCPDLRRAVMAVTAAALLWWAPLPAMIALPVLMLAAGAVGAWALAGAPFPLVDSLPGVVSASQARWAMVLLLLLLLWPPMLLWLGFAEQWVWVGGLLRAGALVFGGGHVVLPLLEAELVAPGYLSQADFLLGYGAAQAVPGPMFSVAAYFGALLLPGAPVWGAAMAVLAIFLPGLLLLVAVLPHWQTLRTQPRLLAAIAGVNAAVVGILAAAWLNPIALHTLKNASDGLLVLLAWLLLGRWRWPVWSVLLFLLAASVVVSAIR